LKRCYKCRNPYLNPTGPQFHEVCEKCESYLHCCQNCRYYDDYAKTKCANPDAEYVSDPNGMNRCEFFQFGHVDASGLKLDEREERPGMRLRPDWRGVKKGNASAPRRSGGQEQRARRARTALDKLFRPSAPPPATGTDDSGGES